MTVMKKQGSLLLILAGLVLAGLVIAAVPSLRDRVVYHLDQWRVKAYYALFPPEEAVFQPGGTPDSTVTAVPVVNTLTPTIVSQPTAELLVVTPTVVVPTPTALPQSYIITDVKWQNQQGIDRWNYCAPANLYMALNYWGWSGTVYDVGDTMKPFQDDKNVMPYEMGDFILENTDYGAVIRYGGTLETIKNFIANGFPVLIEKGTYILETTTNRMGWMGHYNFVNGYDDGRGVFIIQDSLLGADYEIAYDVIEKEWRAFGNTFMLVYPPEREGEVFALLGDYADVSNSYQMSAQVAADETATLTGVDRFFAWFNRGSALVRLQDYNGAATAYDEAFRLYAELPDEERPWRMMWYQTGPYFAYFYTGRYQDVVDLADLTISAANQPYLEESWYWRGRAKAALGDLTGAQADICQSLEYHPGFPPAIEVSRNLGIFCP